MACYKVAERFRELTARSCAAGEMNHSLLATKNEQSLFHHSFNMSPPFAECSRAFHQILSILKCLYDFVRFYNTGNSKGCQMRGNQLPDFRDSTQRVAH
jgi:hypothetical protein